MGTVTVVFAISHHLTQFHLAQLSSITNLTPSFALFVHTYYHAITPHTQSPADSVHANTATATIPALKTQLSVLAPSDTTTLYTTGFSLSMRTTTTFPAIIRPDTVFTNLTTFWFIVSLLYLHDATEM
jgi:hypothetical protein